MSKKPAKKPKISDSKRQLSIYIDVDLYEFVKEIAEREDRSMNFIVERALRADRA